MPSQGFLSLSEQLTQKARVALDLGRPEEAVPLLLQALTVTGSGSEKAVVMERLSYAFGQTGDKDAALLWAERTIAASPDWCWAHFRRAGALENIERIDEAVSAAQTALHLAPEVPWISQALARLYLKKKAHAEAEIHAARFRELAPDDANAYYYTAEVALEKADAIKGRQERRALLERAESDLRTGLALDPESPYLQRLMGRLRQKQNKPVDALFFYLEAVRQMPTSDYEAYNIWLMMDTVLAGRTRITHRQLAQYLLCGLIQVGSLILHKGAWAAFFIAFSVSFVSDAVVMFAPAAALRRYAFFRRANAETRRSLLELAERQRKHWKEKKLRFLIPLAFASLINVPLLVLRGLWEAGVWAFHFWKPG